MVHSSLSLITSIPSSQWSSLRLVIFDVLTDIALELIYFSQSHGSDSAIINVNNDDNELTGLFAPGVHSLINRTLGEAQFINKYLYQPLVPMVVSLLQIIQGLSETTDLVGAIDRFEARGLVHVYHFVIGECAIEIRAFDISLMEL